MDKQTIQNKLNDVYIENNATPTFAFYSDLLIENGEIDKALLILEQSVKKHPEYELGHFILGKAYYQKGDLEGAKAELDRATAYFPDLTNAYLLLLDIAKKRNSKHLIDTYEQKLKFIDPIFYHEFKSATIKPVALDDSESGFEELSETDGDSNTVIDEANLSEKEETAVIEEIDENAATTAELKEDVAEQKSEMDDLSEELIPETSSEITDELDIKISDEAVEEIEEVDNSANIDLSAIENDIEETETEIDTDTSIDNLISDLDDMDELEVESFKSGEEKNTVESEVINSKEEAIDLTAEADDDIEVDSDIDLDNEIDIDNDNDNDIELDDDIELESDIDIDDDIELDMDDDIEISDDIEMDDEISLDDDIEIDDSIAVDDVIDEEISTVDSIDINEDLTIEDNDVFDIENDIDVSASTNKAEEKTDELDQIIDKVDDAIGTMKSPMIDDDSLIDELNMVQKKDSANDAVASDPAIASPTLGEIYLSQGKFIEAKQIFEALLKKDPENDKIKRKLDDINKILG